MGIMPWSPLAGGFLTGKYVQDSETSQPANGAEGRLSGANPFSGANTKFTARNWQILGVLREVAGQLDRPLAQVALAWTLARPGITSPIIGASRPAQVADSLAALEIEFSPDQLAALNHASAPEVPEFFSAGLKQMVFGGTDVRGWND